MAYIKSLYRDLFSPVLRSHEPSFFCLLLVLALIRVCVTVASEYQGKPIRDGEWRVMSSPSWKKNLFGGIIGDTSLFVSLQHDSEELLMLRILR